MTNKPTPTEEYYILDLAYIFRSLWKRAWAILLVSILGAAIGFGCSAFLMTPMYSAEITLYVNNQSNTEGTISSSALSAAQSLVKTYIGILDSQTTLEQVVTQAQLSCSYKELSEMISAQAVDDTELFRVTVTCDDAETAVNIANAVAAVLPDRVAEIIQGSSMHLVDAARPNYDPVSPSIRNYTIIGFALGFLMSAAYLAVMALMNNTIHDEESLRRSFNYPILANIPDLNAASTGKYAYAPRGGNHA